MCVSYKAEFLEIPIIMVIILSLKWWLRHTQGMTQSTSGARITDAVLYHGRGGRVRHAVDAVRYRAPDAFRWRRAVNTLNQHAGRLRGRDRGRVVEPVREVVLDIKSENLRKEVAIDARRHRVMLDRGDILPSHTAGDLRRYAHIVGAEVEWLEKHIPIGDDFSRPIDTAGAIVVSRSYSTFFRQRAERCWLQVPDPDLKVPLTTMQKSVTAAGEYCDAQAKRWRALADRLLEGPEPMW